jgi:hypothetical protein
LKGRREQTVRDDQGTLLLQVRRQLCTELTAAHGELGVHGRQLGHEVGRGVGEQHHDLLQRRQ